MAVREPTEQATIDIYDLDPIPWSRPRDQLVAGSTREGSGRDTGRTYWLATVRPDGRPHATAVGALWEDDRVYFTSGPGTRKSRNLAADPRCTITVSLDDIDLVIEGSARRVTDPATLEKLASLYRDQGWPAEVSGDALSAPYSAPSAERRHPGISTRSSQSRPSAWRRPSPAARCAGDSTARSAAAIAEPRLSRIGLAGVVRSK
jgi:hypothetical protein